MKIKLLQAFGKGFHFKRGFLEVDLFVALAIRWPSCRSAFPLPMNGRFSRWNIFAASLMKL